MIEGEKKPARDDHPKLYRYILTITATIETALEKPDGYEKNFAQGFIRGMKSHKGFNCTACNVELEELADK